jgi:hypothetical protein
MRASMMSFVLVIGSILPAAAQIVANTDRPGGDYKGVYLKNASDCMSACSRDDRCSAWTFVKRDGHCMLKNPAPEQRSDTCCDSGLVLRALGKARSGTSSPPTAAPKPTRPPAPVIARDPPTKLDNPEEGLDGR